MIRKLNFGMTATLLLSFYSFSAWSFDQSPEKLELRIGDRLLLELDTTVYSQRNMEAYLYVKHGVFTNGSIRRITPEKWQVVRDEFLSDMIVDREASKLGSFRVNPETMKKALESLERAQEVDPNFRTVIASLQLTLHKTQQEISTALRIEAYKRGKSTDRNLDFNILTALENENLQKQAWFLKLKQGLMYRWYSGASSFARISFNE